MFNPTTKPVITAAKITTSRIKTSPKIIIFWVLLFLNFFICVSLIGGSLVAWLFWLKGEKPGMTGNIFDRDNLGYMFGYDLAKVESKLSSS